MATAEPSPFIGFATVDITIHPRATDAEEQHSARAQQRGVMTGGWGSSPFEPMYETTKVTLH